MFSILLLFCIRFCHTPKKKLCALSQGIYQPPVFLVARHASRILVAIRKVMVIHYAFLALFRRDRFLVLALLLPGLVVYCHEKVVDVKRFTSLHVTFHQHIFVFPGVYEPVGVCLLYQFNHLVLAD